MDKNLLSTKFLENTTIITLTLRAVVCPWQVLHGLGMLRPRLGWEHGHGRSTAHICPLEILEELANLLFQTQSLKLLDH